MMEKKSVFDPIKEIENGSRFILVDLKDFDINKLNRLLLPKCTVNVKAREDGSRYVVKNYAENYSSSDASALNRKFITLFKDIVKNRPESYKFVITRNDTLTVDVHLVRFVTETELEEDQDFLKEVSKTKITGRVRKMALFRSLDALSFPIDHDPTQNLLGESTVSAIDSTYIKYIPFLKTRIDCGDDACLNLLEADFLLSCFNNVELFD